MPDQLIHGSGAQAQVYFKSSTADSTATTALNITSHFIDTGPEAWCQAGMSAVTRKVSGRPGPGPGSPDGQLRAFLVSPLYFLLNGQVPVLLLVQDQASVHPLEWMGSP